MLLHFGKSNPFARLKKYCRATDEIILITHYIKFYQKIIMLYRCYCCSLRLRDACTVLLSKKFGNEYLYRCNYYLGRGVINNYGFFFLQSFCRSAKQYHWSLKRWIVFIWPTCWNAFNSKIVLSEPWSNDDTWYSIGGRL